MDIVYVRENGVYDNLHSLTFQNYKRNHGTNSYVDDGNIWL